MVKLGTELVPTLAAIPDEVLAEITADGHTFAGAAWYRMLESLQLPTLLGGQPRLWFAVVCADETPVCVCPILRASGQGIYFVYSLRRYFFEHWIEEAVRLNPDRQEQLARMFGFVSVYRKLLEASGSRLDDALIVTNPLSYRGEIPVAPSSPVPRSEVYRALLRELQRVARKSNLPLWFLGVQGQGSRLARALKAGGCRESFLFYDNRLDLGACTELDDYLHSFRRTTRRALLRDIQRSDSAGVEYRVCEDLGPYAEELTRLYDRTYSKYGESFFRHPPLFWSVLQQHLGKNAEAILASRGGELIGFTVLLKSPRRGEMWTYRIGRSDASELANVPFYFGLSFYEPIRRAIALGCRRLWLGPASYEAKSVRGAEQVSLYNYFWFPRRPDRWLLGPYLELFGQVSRDQIAESMQRPVRVADAIQRKNRRRTPDS